MDEAVARQVSTAVAVVLVFTLIRPTHRIFIELKFYNSKKWDLWLDSGNKIWAQDTFVGYLPHWPIGAAKFFAEGILIVSRLALIALFLFQI